MQFQLGSYIHVYTNETHSGVDVAGACGLREKKHFMLSLERWSAKQLATPGMCFGSNSIS